MSGPRLVWERPRTKAVLLGGIAAVQTPANDCNQAPAFAHPDERQADAVRAAWWSGHDMAERRYYTAGWRAGARTGLLCALATGTLGLVLGLAAPAAITSAGLWLATWVGL